MNPALVRKMQKAKDYAVQPERVNLTQCKITLKGRNDDHELLFDSGTWICSCKFFTRQHTCSHVMAMQIMLDGMVANRSELGSQTILANK